MRNQNLVSTIKQSPIGFTGQLVEKPNFGFSGNGRDIAGLYLISIVSFSENDVLIRTSFSI